ncbi:polyphosphate kinase 2 [Bradyrhizobium sp. USDA 4486]
MTDRTSQTAKRERIIEEMADDLDEELEMELDDTRLDELLDETDVLNPTLDRKLYFRELLRLQGELVKLQDWVQAEKKKVVVLFEGRDSAGKGGVIKRITQRLNPRICRVAALPAPSERERTQWYFQRYVAHLPAGGEMVLFDRSWYNRAGVERVMGFCTEEQYQEFFKTVPEFERMLIRSGIILLKYWFSITDDEQQFRFTMRIKDPLKQWKLSPMDVEARSRWEAYTPRRPCWSTRTCRIARGGSSMPSTRSAPGSTASRICSARSHTRKWRARRWCCRRGCAIPTITAARFRRRCTCRRNTDRDLVGWVRRAGAQSAASRRNPPLLSPRQENWWVAPCGLRFAQPQG